MTPPEAVVTREREVSPPPGPEKGTRCRQALGLASDERLAKRAGAGDPDAFAAIFRRYERDLYRFCVGILGEPQDAQDAIQNTMLKVLRALPGERREIQLKPWLYRIAHNEAIEVRRRQRPVEPLEPGIVDAGLSIDESAERNERLRLLFRDMTDLPQRQRAALVMRELNGLEFGEIGAALGTSPSAVRQALYEARRGLQQMELGRNMDCDAVTLAISHEDGRLRGRRDIRAHLRDCSECRRFRREIEERKQALAAISPLPALVAGALLKGTLAGSGAGGAGAGGAGAVGVSGGIAASVAGGSGLAKSVAGLLAVVALGTAAADRSGLVDLHGGRSGAVIESQAAPVSLQGSAATSDSPNRTAARGPQGADTDPARDSSPSAVAPSRGPEIDPSAGDAVQATGTRIATSTPRSSGNADRSAQSGGPGSAAVPPLAAPGGNGSHKQETRPDGSAGEPSQSGQSTTSEDGPKEGKEPKGGGGAQAEAKPEKPHGPPMAEEKQAKSEARAEEKQAKAEARAEDRQVRVEKKEGKANAKTETSGPKGEAMPDKPAAAPKPTKDDAESAAPAPAGPVRPSQPQSEAATPAPGPPAEPETAEAPAETLPANGKGGGAGNNGNGSTKKEATTEAE